MKFTKIKNFTESNEVRIKAFTSKGVIINKLVIYIGKEIADKHFSESNYVNVKVIKDKSGRNDIHLFKPIDGSDLRKYKFAVTGNGTCQTRKLLISMPEDTDMNKYINNKSVIYSNIDNTLILHIDSKIKSKKSKKINKNKLMVNGIDQATLDKQERDKLLDLYEIRTDLDSNNQYRYEELKKLVRETILRLDFLDKNVSFLLPICKAIDRLEDKINTITSKITPNENNSRELNNLGYDKLIVDLINHKHKTEERLMELENKVKNIKADKRSLFGRIFGE